jgi:hypothetical protein
MKKNSNGPYKHAEAISSYRDMAMRRIFWVFAEIGSA